jgi:hypothetical protein
MLKLCSLYDSRKIHTNVSFSFSVRCSNWSLIEKLPEHKVIYIYAVYTQNNGAFSKANKKFISRLTWAQLHRKQRQLLLISYQQFTSHAYCGVDGPVSKMASQQEKAFCVLRFVVSRSVITVQSEIRAQFRNTRHPWCVFSKTPTKLTINTFKPPHSFVYSLCMYMLIHCCL